MAYKSKSMSWSTVRTSFECVLSSSISWCRFDSCLLQNRTLESIKNSESPEYHNAAFM